MGYLVELNFGASWEDISDKLHGRNPIRRTRAIHAKDDPSRPQIGTARFVISRDVTLINRFLSASAPISVRIQKDGAPYFLGAVRNTHKVKIGLMSVERFAVEAVDSWYRLEKKCSLSATWSNYQISNPSLKSESILHQVFYAAGFDDAELSLPAVAVSIDRAVFDPSKARSYRAVIEEILKEVAYSAYVDASGVVRLYDLAPGSITPVATLSSGSSGNIASDYEIERQEAKAEAVDVSYWPHRTLASQVVFEDTTGAGATPCSIPLAATEYYPEGADASHSVKGNFKVKDYDLVAVDSPVIEWSKTGDVVKQVEVLDGLGMLMRFYSATGGVITKLKVRGDAVVKGDLYKVIKETVANTEKRESLSCAWIYTAANAERLAISRASWHHLSEYLYIFPEITLLTITPGDYLTLNEASILGASTTLRVVSVEDGETPKSIKVVCEGAAPYSYAALPIESTSGQPPPPNEDLQDTTIGVSAFINNTPPSNNITDLVITSEINSDGSININLEWAYTQGAIPADGFLVYYKSYPTTPSAIDLYNDDSEFVASTKLKHKLASKSARYAGVGASARHYRFGVVAVGIRAAGMVAHTGGVVEDAAWIDKTFIPSITGLSIVVGSRYDENGTDSGSGTGVYIGEDGNLKISGGEIVAADGKLLISPDLAGYSGKGIQLASYDLIADDSVLASTRMSVGDRGTGYAFIVEKKTSVPDWRTLGQFSVSPSGDVYIYAATSSLLMGTRTPRINIVGRITRAQGSLLSPDRVETVEIKSGSYTQNQIFDWFDVAFAYDSSGAWASEYVSVRGFIRDDGASIRMIVTRARKTSASTITFYGFEIAYSMTPASYVCTNGNSTSLQVDLVAF